MAKATAEKVKIEGEEFTVVWNGDLDPDYRRSPKTNNFCCICQRDISKPVEEVGYVHMIENEGDYAFLSVADEARYNALSTSHRDGDRHYALVGSECERKFPSGFVHKG